MFAREGDDRFWRYQSHRSGVLNHQRRRERQKQKLNLTAFGSDVGIRFEHD
jgi:hypothetical protein